MGILDKLMGVDSAVKNGVSAVAVIQGITDTGTTVTMPSTGPDAPVYKLDLLITPAAGGAPYAAVSKAAIPRLFIPMTLPGARIGVLVDPANPAHVSPDWQNYNQGAGIGMGAGMPGYGVAGMGMPGYGAPGMGGMAAPGAGAAPGGGMDVQFDASGQPNMAEVAAVAGAVHSGQMPTHAGSAAQLLATGVRGTATVTSAMPLGKTVGQINPNADPATLNDPVWMFTLTVQLPGQAPFPGMMGHRVPMDKLGAMAPGVRLAVAVNPSNPSQEIAIDWSQSPMA